SMPTDFGSTSGPRSATSSGSAVRTNVSRCDRSDNISTSVTEIVDASGLQVLACFSATRYIRRLMAVKQNLDELRGSVRAKGLRATPSRLAVLELLRSSDAPMSHGDVADRLASQAWDRATIYRNLTDLAEAGLVRRTDVG